MGSAGEWHGLALPTEAIATLDTLVAPKPAAARRVVLAGPRGAGKSSVAQRIAEAQAATLYRVDLAAVVSKYLGETEKQLDALFAAAEQAGAVLLIDEADALFGRRSDVQDAHDRYANLEVERLIRRIADYRGPAVVVEIDDDAPTEPPWAGRIGPVVRLPARRR